MASSSMEIVLKPRHVTVFFTVVTVVLVVLHGLGQFSRFYLGHDHVFGLVRMFSLGRECNVPAFYSAVLILSCTVLLGGIAAGRRRDGASDALH